MTDDSNYKLAYERQKLARERAEALLESRSRELFDANVSLTNTIKELRTQEEQMVQQEKLASIGLLAAGIAHEINNPVGFVKSNLETLKTYLDTLKLVLDEFQLLLEKLTDSNEASKFSDDIARLKDLIESSDLAFVSIDSLNSIEESLDGTARIENIVRDLKGFSRTDDEVRSELNINRCIEGAINLVWSEIKYKCQIDRGYGEIPLIYGFASQLTQVFINLILNAAQAIESKGVIAVRTWADQDNVYASVIDSGPGIPRENLMRLFVPFFTTKEVGSGTGLGLYVSHSLIQKHQGSIIASNEPGKGAKFVISLPIDMRANRRNQTT